MHSSDFLRGFVGVDKNFNIVAMIDLIYLLDKDRDSHSEKAPLEPPNFYAGSRLPSCSHDPLLREKAELEPRRESQELWSLLPREQEGTL